MLENTFRLAMFKVIYCYFPPIRKGLKLYIMIKKNWPSNQFWIVIQTLSASRFANFVKVFLTLSQQEWTTETRFQVKIAYIFCRTHLLNISQNILLQNNKLQIQICNPVEYQFSVEHYSSEWYIKWTKVPLWWNYMQERLLSFKALASHSWDEKVEIYYNCASRLYRPVYL